ncbi:MAG: type III secretion system cytoplasmic ring protein SctQ [Ramlibacter sp.]|jgi:type III secretion protein Q
MKTSQARVRRLSPVVWEATQVQARDVLAQRVQALQVDWGGSTWTLTLTPSMACGALDVGDGECCLQCAWASVAWDLVLSQGVVQARIRARYPQVDASEIPEPIAAACLEEAVQSLAAAIESLGYGSARIDQLLQGPAQTRPMAHVFDLRARCGDVVVVARLGTSPLGLSLLADLACGLPPAANDLPVESLPMVWRAEIGCTWLAAHEVACLSVGDSVLLEQSHFDGDRRLWLACADMGLRVVIGATGLTVATPLDEEGWTMHPDPDVSPSPADQVAIDHLPLRLVFDLGEVAMPLEAVRQLQAGQTIDLGHPLERAVRVRVNGVHIATGELVDIDGHLGVTLTALVRRPQTSAPRITARAGAAPQAHDLPERP